MNSPRATLLLRIPLSLHQRLKQEARTADVSLNKHCHALLNRKAGDASVASNPGASTHAAGPSRRITPLNELTAKVVETWGGEIEGLVLFGSFARGRQTANSDIDLLVVLNSDVTLDRDVYSRWEIHKFDGREVAPLFVRIPRKEESVGGLWFEVALDGIVLYDRDLRLSRFLSRVRDLVAAGTVQRKITHGHPYWVHSGKAGADSSPAEGT